MTSGPLQTPLCDVLGIRHPVLLAPMAGGFTTPELVAAVSEAGGLGVFGANGMSVEALRAAVRRARELTSAPVGVNVLFAAPAPPHGDAEALAEAVAELRSRHHPEPAAPAPGADTVDLLRAALDEGVQVLSVALGDPAPGIELARAAGVPLIAMAATAHDAARCAAAGADVVVAQGAEAGGHRSTIDAPADAAPPLVGLTALVPQARAVVDVPLVASGGIADGRGVAAALALGADGVQIGTLFMVAREAGTPPAYRARLRAATDADTVVTTVASGRPARLVRNDLIDTLRRTGEATAGYPAQRGVVAEFASAGRARGDAELMAVYAGQATGLLPLDDEPAAAILQGLLDGAHETIARLARLAEGA